jgi:hypothetical protein
MAKSGNLISIVIVGVVLFFGYQYIQKNGGLQGLIDKLKGATGGAAGGAATGGGATTAAPCQGKDSTGAACDCSASSTGNVTEVPIWPIPAGLSNIAYATKKTSTKAPAKGAKTPAAGKTTTPAAGTCDCSGCTGATTPAAGGGGGNVWGQNPASKTPCDIPGQSCPTLGALGGTSQWCKCVAGGGGGTTKTKGTTTKTTKSTKGGGTNTATSTTSGLAHALLAGAELDYGFHEPHVGPSRNAYIPRYFSNVGYSN